MTDASYEGHRLESPGRWTVPSKIGTWKDWYVPIMSLLVLTAIGAPIAAADGDGPTTAPIKLYVDESRSLQLPIILWKQLGPRDGCFQTRVMDLITYERLRQYDVMIIWNQIDNIAYSKDELAAVRQFVAAGGGLLILGTPKLDASERAPFRQGRFVNIKPVPASRYSLNQIAALFGAAFTNASRPDTPTFSGGSEVTGQAKVDQLGFKQPLAVINPPATRCEILLHWHDHPVAAALASGKGRVILCGADRLFLQYGKLVDRKQGKTDNVIEQQKALLMAWTSWLAERSLVRDRTAADIPEFVPGRMHLEADQIDVYCIPQLGHRARTLVTSWQQVWKEFKTYTGLKSPVELVDGASADRKLQVYLRMARAGGLSGGASISIAGLADEEWRLIGVLGHEVGHKLLGGCNASISEAFAEWMNARGLAAAGFTRESRTKINDHVAHFFSVDPDHNKLDIADARTDVTQSAACQGKWIWILGQLQDKYGQDLIRKYVAALRQDVTLRGPAHKLLPNGKRAKLTMADHVRAFSTAVGEDLTPWFRELGITVKYR